MRVITKIKGIIKMHVGYSFIYEYECIYNICSNVSQLPILRFDTLD